MLRATFACLVLSVLVLLSSVSPALADRHDHGRVIIVNDRCGHERRHWRGHGHNRWHHRHDRRYGGCEEVRVRETVRVTPPLRQEVVREVWVGRPAW